MPQSRSPLAAWEAAEQRKLDGAGLPESDRPVLLRLLETSCLLELSKLTSAQLDLGSYAQQAVDILTQFFSVDGLALELSPPGLPAIRVAAGEFDGDDEPLRFPVASGGGEVGALVVDRLPAFLETPQVFVSAANQLSSGLDVLLETEHLRRQAATANAARLAAGLATRLDDEDLEALVGAVAALPGVTGASLRLESAAAGGAVDLQAGVAGAVSTEHDLSSAATVPLLVTIGWAAAPSAGDRRQVEDVLTELATSLATGERARRLEAENETDDRTGVGNRRRASRALAAAVNRAERTGEPVAVVVLRPDGPLDDAEFKALAGLADHEARNYDTVARIDDERLAVVCPATDVTGGQALAHRLRRLAPSVTEGRTISAGIAVYPDAADHADGVLRAAVEALTGAQRAGKDTAAVAARTGR